MALRSLPTVKALMKIFAAVYDVQQPKDLWLNGVLRAVAPAMDRGEGVGGALYDVSVDSPGIVEVMDGIGITSEWREAGLALHRDSRFIPQIFASYRTATCATIPELIEDPEVTRRLRTDYFAQHGVHDQIIINGLDCSGKGCVLYVFSRSPLAISDGQRDVFRRLATHLATAYRLQRQLAGGEPPTINGLEAVLTPVGQVKHAEADAKSVQARRDLTLAVRQRERVRDCPPMNAERVVRSLRGLVSARWTLVDHYESDGKRYVLARENAPKPLEPVRLSGRERQVVALAALGRSNKLIAYELGLAYSTVRVLMARASAKLGATSRSELIARQHGRVGLTRPM
jgi:DNA-binding CsgD family transcriptional regulator